MSTAAKTWTPTKYRQIYRHQSGTYYARIIIEGKQTWRSLQTSVISIAKEKLEELRDEEAHRRELNPEEVAPERMTGADVIALRKHQLEITPTIKGSTRHYWKAIILSLERSWPEFQTMDLRKITDTQCQEWASKASKAMSSTRFNNSIGLLKARFEIAIKKGVRRSNPAKDLSARPPLKGEVCRMGRSHPQRQRPLLPPLRRLRRVSGLYRNANRRSPRGRMATL